ncbi:MAG: DNA (cytosine-5-)-methyltransferase [Sporichthyaceae bacterium]
MAESKRGGYGVKLVRGPFVRLDPHPDHCEDEGQFLGLTERLRAAGTPLAADLFAGAGGLSLGLEQAGFRVVLSADRDAEAVETHRHHFGGLALDWDMGDQESIAGVARLMREAGVDLLAGGPPCQPFSKAGRSKARHLIRNGYADPNDGKRDLWRSFLEVVRLARPRAVLMENVPDMTLDREMFILRAMVEELERIGYAVEERVVETFRYGVPQFRQRLVLVALRDGIRFDWPPPDETPVYVRSAIGDLPEVAGGWRPDGGAAGWAHYPEPDSPTPFQTEMRSGVVAADRHKLFDHITRPVREDDARAFEYMTSSTRYSDLPDEFKRYREDIFDDKYKRLSWDDYSRTITAHIAKDGYWYIHPQQNRTLTVREAARIQTFPDHFRFAGPPSAAFRQIGNAVPPRLGERIGGAILKSLAVAERETTNTTAISATLAGWYRANPPRILPWLEATSRWQVVCGETLLDKAQARQVRAVWSAISRCARPGDPSSAAYEAEMYAMAEQIGRGHKAAALKVIGARLIERPDLFDSDDFDGSTLAEVGSAVADLAVLAVPSEDEDHSEEPVLVTKGVLRVAERYFANEVNARNKLSDGRMAIARMIGGGSGARAAHKALVELANSLCTPRDPSCPECPLLAGCQRQGLPPANEGLF